MDLLTFSETTNTWVAFAGILQGLKASFASSDELLLFSTDPAAELGELLALIELFGVCGGQLRRMAVASPHPTLDWACAVHAAGVERICFAAPRDGSGRLEMSGDGLLAVPRDLCPALHVRVFDGRPASVCGNRWDRLVLGRRSFAEQCFGRWKACQWNPAGAAGREEPCISLLSAADASDRPSRTPAPVRATTWSSSTPTPAPSASWGRDSTA
jgi:hypothetical protein